MKLILQLLKQTTTTTTTTIKTTLGSYVAKWRELQQIGKSVNPCSHSLHVHHEGISLDCFYSCTCTNTCT